MPKERPADENAKAGAGAEATNTATAKETPATPAVETKKEETPVDVQVHLDKIEELQDSLSTEVKRAEDAEKLASDTKADLDTANGRVIELEGLLATANETIAKFENAPKAEIAPAIQGDANLAEMATVAEPTVKMVTVKFLKDHSFSFGMQDVRALKNDKKEVDVATANKLTSRGIAVMIN